MDKIAAFQIWLGVSALVIIFGMWAVVAVRYMRSVRHSVEIVWFKIDEHFRKRHDLVPGLIEIVKAGSEGSGFERLITARNLARREILPGPKKAELEKALGQAVAEVASGFTGGGAEFLEYKSDIRAAEEAVKLDTEVFNKHVDHHNIQRRIWWLRPVCKVMRYDAVERF